MSKYSPPVCQFTIWRPDDLLNYSYCGLSLPVKGTPAFFVFSTVCQSKCVGLSIYGIVRVRSLNKGIVIIKLLFLAFRFTFRLSVNLNASSACQFIELFVAKVQEIRAYIFFLQYHYASCFNISATQNKLNGLWKCDFLLTKNF